MSVPQEIMEHFHKISEYLEDEIDDYNNVSPKDKESHIWHSVSIVEKWMKKNDGTVESLFDGKDDHCKDI